MKYLIVAVGLMLVAAGATSIWQGMDIVQIERGWTQVIAGATVFTGGVITAVLGLLIHQIGLLRDALRAPSSGSSQIEAAEKPRPAAIEKSESPPPPAPPVPTPPVSAPPAPPVRPVVAKDDAVIPFGAPQPRADPARRAPAEPPQRPVFPPARKPAPDTAPPAPSPVKAAPPAARPPSPSESGPPIRPRGAPQPQALAVEKVATLALNNRRRHATRADVEGRVKSLGVTRRYEANGIQCAIYSDGSIDAETPAGTLHFADMDELSAYLDKPV